MLPDRPYVILNAAMSLDGKIATRTGESRLSSPEDLRRVHKLRSQVDGIMVGLGTVLVDDPKLTVKHHRGKKPARIILDSLARTPSNTHVVRTACETPTIIAVTANAPQKRCRNLERMGVVIVRAGTGSLVSLPLLLRKLRRMGVRKLLLEGGGTVNWSMLESGLVDEVSVAVSPLVIGGVDATSLVEGRGAGAIESAVRLKLESIRKYGNSLVLAYRLSR